jgi:murein L,D-transpeptidase YcbB/YkuD
MAKHLKQGRLQYDSVTLRKDTVLAQDFFLQVYDQIKRSGDLVGTLQSLEPKHDAYDSLKTGLKFFLDSVTTFRRFTYLPYPGKDSASFYSLLQKRFFEDDIVLSATDQMDTAQWRAAIRSYQQAKGLKVTGKINESTVQNLNNTDWEKFKRIAINLDRYKLLPDSLPDTYVWVNLPSYRLKLVDSDSVVLESRSLLAIPKRALPYLHPKYQTL